MVNKDVYINQTMKKMNSNNKTTTTRFLLEFCVFAFNYSQVSRTHLFILSVSFSTIGPTCLYTVQLYKSTKLLI